jgi:hypothetical protein
MTVSGGGAAGKLNPAPSLRLRTINFNPPKQSDKIHEKSASMFDISPTIALAVFVSAFVLDYLYAGTSWSIATCRCCRRRGRVPRHHTPGAAAAHSGSDGAAEPCPAPVGSGHRRRRLSGLSLGGAVDDPLLLSILSAEPNNPGRLPEFRAGYAKINITLFRRG